MRLSIFLFSLIFLLFSCKSVISQQAPSEDESGIFAYANNDKGKFATNDLKKRHYKYDVTQKVLTDLVNAKGDKRMPVPKLKMSNGQRYVAYAKPNEAIIALEIKAYDICTSFGKDSLNAMAALLAHELTHYYEKHDWTSHFVNEHKGMNVSSELKDLKEKMKLETQADYLGGFLAYTAGYPTLEIMPDFLSRVYDGYDFPDKMKGYPDLPERQKIAAQALKKLQDLVSVFEMANWLVAIEHYEDALKYYEHILLEGQYQSREIYNNMGVMAVLAAMSYFKDSELKYVFPVELDPLSRINGPGTKGNMGYGEKIEALLDIAVGHFTVGLTLDEEYSPALLNIGCAYALKENYRKAKYHAETAIEVADNNNNNKTLADAKCLLGIIAALQNNNDDADNLFDKAIALGSPLAKINKDIMNDVEVEGHLFDMSRPVLEKIDGVKLPQLVTKNEMGALEDKFSKKVNLSDKIFFRVLDYPQSKVLIHDMPFDEAYAFFHITNPDYSGQTKHSIGLNASRADLLAAYGSPQRTMELTNGQYMIYNKQKLIFVMNNHDRIRAWSTYRFKKADEE